MQRVNSTTLCKSATDISVPVSCMLEVTMRGCDTTQTVHVGCYSQEDPVSWTVSFQSEFLCWYVQEKSNIISYIKR